MHRTWKIFRDFLPNRRNQRIITPDISLGPRAVLSAEVRTVVMHPTYLHTPSALSRQETALYGRHEVIILGIWVIMTSVHPSTRDQRRLRWDWYYIGFPGKPKENLTSKNYRFLHPLVGLLTRHPVCYIKENSYNNIGRFIDLFGS